MKVMMFGWEFPPHISGGLGTACAGLTHALEKEHVDILFAVPKLHGGERADRTTFLNASTIPIRQQKATKAPSRHPGRSDSHTTSKSTIHRAHKSGVSRTTIEVEVELSPYTSVSNNASGIEHWNYSFDQTIGHQKTPLKKSGGLRAGKSVGFVKQPYEFSGTYGVNLLEEVQRYAQAGAEIARRNSFDVIHAHDWMTFRAGIEAKRVSGKPLIVHVHATEIDRSGAHVNPVVFAIEKEGMMRADKVVTVSQWTKNIAIKHYEVDENKIVVVHNGIAQREHAHVPMLRPVPDSRIVTFLGRVTHQKGPMYFVEAARIVHGQFPDAHFVVAGSGDQLPQMIERIAQVRMSKNFHFTGFLRGEDVDRIWSMSHVYVMPSVSEPFGIAPLEAIQAGVPVIISNQAGVSEVMPHAIKVDFWNTEALAEAICNVLRFESLANTLKKNGSEHIKDITWDKAAKKLNTLYHELTTTREKSKKRRSVLSSPPAETVEQAPVF